MVAWPDATYLPQFVDQDGYAQTTQDPLLRTDMDAGPMKVRLRYTAVPEQFNITLTLTKTQLGYFVTTFFKNTLGYGAEAFAWKHPVTQANASCRFTSMYSIAPHGIDFKVTISMEILP